MEVEVRVKFNERGFTPGKDIQMEEWEALKAQSLQMYNLWVDGVNQIQYQINELWRNYETIKETKDILATFMCQRAMGIDENTDYYDWCKKWYTDVAESIDLGFMHTRLRSRISRSGENLVYGVVFTDHQDWTMDWTMELV